MVSVLNSVSSSIAPKVTRSTSVIRGPSPPGSSTWERTQDGEIVDSSPVHSDLADQVGYSNITIGNALSSLHDSLLRVDGNIASTNHGSKNAISEHIREKYQKLIGQLPENDVVTDLVNIFFTELNDWALVIEQHFFNKALSAWDSASGFIASGRLNQIQNDTIQFPALLFQLLAVGLQISPPESKSSKLLFVDGSGARENLSFRYSQLATSLMELIGKNRPTVTSVQHNFLLGLWLKNRSQGTESWRVLNSAVRQAQDLGLHRETKVFQSPGEEFTDVLARIWYGEYKRRLWVSLFIWDSHMAIMLGRPRIIHRSDCTVPTPTDCDIPTYALTRIPMPSSSGFSSYTYQLFNYALSHKIHEMLSLNSVTSNIRGYQNVQRLENEVLFMMNGLPACLRPYNPDLSWDESYPYLPLQRLQIGVVVNAYITALHRPHAGIQPLSREAGVKAAVDTLEFQQRQFEMLKPHQYRIYGFSFFTINAGLFLSAITLDHAPGPQGMLGTILDVLRKAIYRLTIMQEQSAMAKSGVEILTQCLNAITAFVDNIYTPGTSFQKEIAQNERKEIDMLGMSAHLQDGSVGSELLSHGLDFNATMLESMGLIPDLMLDPSLGSSEWFGFTV
ncbi:hypothetical protein GLAREA_01704 [Glarea lozoyensis ATCC 20868]|uniref:Xylanolytic transcriptional activator regulatory domain-containing protein n=1 Tax=Glarea lozoyensis (strain ATCC 20868 / MF5171) TaxID=1116229 RepID=S3CH74_GLAL2|nr:uncharacterized protein GLAREA_01704 [Glarea lozoyensis ATCC 20868]EPE25792.1 hypothetical protein GLAREA_01704 [Glarea lozoyensis ATCC 20868]